MIKQATFTYNTLKVGVVFWAAEFQWFSLEFFQTEDEVCNDYVNVVKENIYHWVDTKNLPYLKEQLNPYEDGWWFHVSKLLNNLIRLSITGEHNG